MALDCEAAVATLSAINATTNDGRGSVVCRTVLDYLRRGDSKSAQLVADLDFDKVTQYPELAIAFKQIGLVSADR